MKPRPRRVENRAAKMLSDLFQKHGHDPVERVPVTGRKGPDISMNDVMLAVDVKSRKEIPVPFRSAKGYDGIITIDGEFVAIRMDRIGKWGDVLLGVTCMLKVPLGYWMHMNEWVQENRPGGLTAIVLHFPGNSMKTSLLLMRKNEYRIFIRRLKDGNRTNDLPQ